MLSHENVIASVATISIHLVRLFFGLSVFD